MNNLVSFFIAFFIAFMVQSPLIGQQTANYISNWHFGDNVGITFGSGAPALSTSAINVYEASTGFSDGSGNNLFYVGAYSGTTAGSGFVVWDAGHNTMPNGDISVDFSSSCGLTCAPIPGGCHQHYIFHLTSTGSGTGVHYSVVDMTLPGNGTAGAPLGDISTTQKDILLYGGDNLAEKLLIVQKGNTENYWVIARSITQDVFYSFEVSAAGINPVPLVSVISPTLWPGPTGSPVFSWVAINKDRNILAEANGWGGNIVLYDFDNLTGTVTFGDEILSGGIGLDIPYGVAFSPNGNVLYTSWYESSSGNTNLSYFDVSAGYGNIAITRQDFTCTSSGTNQSAAVVKGPDNKLYSPLHNYADLSVVDDPDNFLAPNINFLSFSVAPDSSIFGLPNLAYYFHPDNFIDTLAGQDRTICINTQTEIGAVGYDSIWANYVWEPAAMLSGSTNEASPFTVDLSSDQEYVLHVIHRCGDTIKSDTILVTVSGLSAGLDSTLIICDDMADFDLLEFMGGYPDPGGTFTPVLSSGSTIFSPVNDGAGIYTYSQSGSCTTSSETTIQLGSCNPCASANNVVPNAGFENVDYCPSNAMQMNAVQNWNNYSGTTGAGTSDYFNTCDHHTIQPHTGNGYAGFISYVNFLTNAREYIQVQLDQPLAAGRCYRASMYLALQEFASHAHDSIGMYFSVVPPASAGGSLLAGQPQIASNFAITDTNWIQISSTFTATGGEEYLTIGVFAEDANLSITSLGGTGTGAYYLVDDICVFEIPHDTVYSQLIPNDTICSLGSSHTFNGPAGYDVYSWTDLSGNPLGNLPSLTILPAGSEQVILEVYNTSSFCPYTITIDTVDLIYSEVTADVTSNAPICQNQTLLLNASPTGLPAGSYAWVGPNGSFGGAGLASVTIVPIPDPIAGGWYYVTVSQGPCFSTDSVFVQADSVYNHTFNVDICSGADYTYADGTTSLNIIANESHTSVLSSIAGCDSTVIENVAIVPPSISSVSSVDVTNCSAPDGEMSVSSLGASNFELYSDANVFIASNTTGAFTGLSPGGYYIIAFNGSCADTSSIQIILSPTISIPTASWNAPICEGDTLLLNASAVAGATYTWSGPGGFSSTNQNNSIPNVNSSYAGTYYVHVTVGICVSESDSVLVSISPPPAISITGTSNFCEGDSTELTETSGAAQHYWSPFGETSSAIYASDPGTYIVTATTADGCSATDSIVIEQLAMPIHNGILGGDACEGFSSLLVSSGTGSLTWSTAEITDSIYVFVAAPTTYYSTYTNSCGSETDSILVDVLPNPLVDAFGDTTIAPMETAQIGAAGGVDYSWSPTDGLSCTSCADPIVNTNQSTLYYVVVTDSNGCSALDSVLITIDYNVPVFVPNVFSPNGDGYNDVVFVRGGSFIEFHFTIYNRWGQVIFQTNDRHAGWDGTFNSKDLDPGVFVYRLTYTDWQGTEGELSGNITLIK